jgi:thymidylate synthase
MDQVRTQLAREPFEPPVMRLNPAVTSLWDFRFEDFELIDYRAHPPIKAPIAV